MLFGSHDRLVGDGPCLVSCLIETVEDPTTARSATVSVLSLVLIRTLEDFTKASSAAVSVLSLI